LIAGSIPVWKAYRRYLIDTVDIDSSKIGVKNGKNVLEQEHRPERFADEFRVVRHSEQNF
jgi:hypothetical protein